MQLFLFISFVIINVTGVHPCFVVFDMLMLNDEKLANLPLKERLEKMERFVLFLFIVE